MKLQNRPWFYGSLSWLIPGMGQFFQGRISKGIAFLFVPIIGLIAIFYLLASSKIVGILPSISIAFFSSVGISIVATWDAVNFAKQNSPEQETKDPWFAIFLSLIAGLFGYLYLRKWLFSFLWLVLLVAGALFVKNITLSEVFVFVISVVVPMHVYLLSSSKYGHTQRNVIIIFLIVIIFTDIFWRCSPYLIVKYVIHTVAVPTEKNSMHPTIKADERFLVNKLTYIFKEPQAGDIVIMNSGKIHYDSNAISSEQAAENSLWAKRIVAVGGDVIEVHDGVIKVNGDIKEYYSHKPERLENGVTQQKSLLAQKEPYLIPEGMFFVIGDNIDNSFDSRHFGAMPREAIAGKAVKVFWPLNNARVLK